MTEFVRIFLFFLFEFIKWNFFLLSSFREKEKFAVKGLVIWLTETDGVTVLLNYKAG